MDPWDAQDLRDHALDRSGVDDEERVVSALHGAAWALGAASSLATVIALAVLGTSPPGTELAALVPTITLLAVAAFALVGCAVCTVCAAVKASELRLLAARR